MHSKTALRFPRLATSAIVLCMIGCASGQSARKPDAPPTQTAGPAAPVAAAQAQAAPAKPTICDVGNDEHEVADEILSRSGRGLLWLIVPGRRDPDMKAVVKRGADEVKSARALADCLLRHWDPGFDAATQNKGQDAFDAWLDAHVGSDHAETLLAASAAYFASLLVAESWIDAALDVPAAKSLLERANAAAPQLADGLGPLILGAYECFVPKAVGGKAEVGLQRLQTAASVPGKLQLAMKVAAAELCAFSLQDRALFNRLLDEVDLSPQTDSTFDMLAKQRAKTLRGEADDMFPEM